HRRTAELGQLIRHRGDVTPPALGVTGAVGRQLRGFALGDEGDALPGPSGQLDPQVDRDRQDEAPAVVGVLADEVDAPRGPESRRHAILNLVKVAFIGAGATVFAKTLIADLISYPELAGGLMIELMHSEE